MKSLLKLSILERIALEAVPSVTLNDILLLDSQITPCFVNLSLQERQYVGSPKHYRHPP